MTGKRQKAVGERGSWYAKVGGERLPCVHRHWLKGMRHIDPGYVPGELYWEEFVEAIRQAGKVVLTNDLAKPAPDKKSGITFDRTGYIAVFQVVDVEADDAGLRFNLAQRLTDLY